MFIRKEIMAFSHKVFAPGNVITIGLLEKITEQSSALKVTQKWNGIICAVEDNYFSYVNEAGEKRSVYLDQIDGMEMPTPGPRYKIMGIQKHVTDLTNA